MQTVTSLHCEVVAPSKALAQTLADITTVCAQDVGIVVSIDTRTSGRSFPVKESVITLHLDVEVADRQHPAWCLACRLACFCPNARVSVLVRSEKFFAPTPAAFRRQPISA